MSLGHCVGRRFIKVPYMGMKLIHFSPIVGGPWFLRTVPVWSRQYFTSSHRQLLQPSWPGVLFQICLSHCSDCPRRLPLLIWCEQFLIYSHILLSWLASVSLSLSGMPSPAERTYLIQARSCSHGYPYPWTFCGFVNFIVAVDQCSYAFWCGFCIHDVRKERRIPLFQVQLLGPYLCTPLQLCWPQAHWFDWCTPSWILCTVAPLSGGRPLSRTPLWRSLRGHLLWFCPVLLFVEQMKMWWWL